jgi:hypothetical protein|nr:MAG TPA: hypothetical protein [Caudoviricetes sp.]
MPALFAANLKRRVDLLAVSNILTAEPKVALNNEITDTTFSQAVASGLLKTLITPYTLETIDPKSITTWLTSVTL